MLHVLDRDNTIHSFAVGAWLKHTTLCPASCCDMACEQCAEAAECPHSRHEQEGLCVVRRDGEADAFVCEGFFVGVRAYSDCACATPECEHFVNSIERERAKHTPGTRPAGVKREQFLRRLPEREGEDNGTRIWQVRE